MLSKNKGKTNRIIYLEKDWEDLRWELGLQIRDEDKELHAFFAYVKSFSGTVQRFAQPVTSLDAKVQELFPTTLSEEYVFPDDEAVSRYIQGRYGAPLAKAGNTHVRQ